MSIVPCRIGTAGWSLARRNAAAFPGPGSHLERYARRLNAVEINSSFYRPHRPGTYLRWAAAVPADFRFAVKVPRAVTHEARLAGAAAALDRFCGEIAGLGDRLGVVLVQLPPSLRFDARVAAAFFVALRARTPAAIVCEPRHSSWFTREAESVLIAQRVARVAADPPPAPGADMPGGWRGLAYFRLHGSPVMYRSAYGADRLAALAGTLTACRGRGTPCWCIFDNTAEVAALPDALALAGLTGPTGAVG